MVRAHQMIPEGAKLILTVHDELVTLTPDHLVDQTISAIREAMEEIKILPIPLVADIKVVTKWGEAK
jgi:DNA polymerase I-like protein with 3'-5' exonuclease and polymerase domains